MGQRFELQCPAHHHSNQLGFVRFARRSDSYELPVAQHGDTIGERKDFVESMADVNNRNLLRPQPTNNPKEPLSVVRGKHCRGFI
jgi:hypothetical protein